MRSYTNFMMKVISHIDDHPENLVTIETTTEYSRRLHLDLTHLGYSVEVDDKMFNTSIVKVDKSKNE